MTLTGFSTSSLHLHDVSDPLAPVRLVDAAPFLSGTTYALAAADAAPEGTAYLATAESAVVDVLSPTLYHPPSGLLAPAEGADEIIVAPAAYVAALEPLADLRRSQGLRVRVVDVADVYALFNGGVYHPEAIRGFVAHAHAHWPGPPPAYLLLVSDGNFNFKGHNPAVYGDFVPSPIPPFLEFADPDQGEVPVDSRYGDVDGDGMPEVMVGRIPAGSLAQVEGVVQKIVAYEAAPPLSPWTERVLMAADDGPEPFTGALNSLANLVPGHVEVRRIYLEEYGDALSATRDLTRTWGQGALLLTYAGHAAVWRWGGSPRLIVNTQLAGLTGTTGLPFLLSLDCWDGYWMFPPEYPGFTGRDVRSIGEWATTVLTDRGAIAAFGPAGLAYLGGEEQVAQAVYGAVFEDGVRELGLLARAGREAISGTYLARTYTLLGDPALRLASVPRRVYVPTVLRSY
jgi:hypothetical protein